MSARMLPDCETEEALPKQQEELKAQVQTDKDKYKALAAKLEDQNKELQSVKRECESLHQRLKYMNGMVAREGAMRHQDESMKKGLYQQLSEVKRQLEVERRLKNKFMAAEKKARKEAERLQEHLNLLSNVKPAQDEPENTNKETLKELEAVRAEYSDSREKSAAQIKVERDKNTGLQRELELIKVSYDEIKYETELKYEKGKNDTLQKELQQARRAHSERIAADLELVKMLMAAKDHLRQQKEEEIRILREDASERERSFAKELDDLRSQLKELTSTNLKLTANIKAEDEDSQDLQQETAELKAEVVQQETEPLCDSQALELLEEVGVAEENLPPKNKKSSMWKRFRHFVGLKKRKRKDPESNSDTN